MTRCRCRNIQPKYLFVFWNYQPMALCSKWSWPVRADRQTETRMHACRQADRIWSWGYRTLGIKVDCVLSYGCHSSVSLPYGAMRCSMICDSGISVFFSFLYSVSVWKVFCNRACQRVCCCCCCCCEGSSLVRLNSLVKAEFIMGLFFF